MVYFHVTQEHKLDNKTVSQTLFALSNRTEDFFMQISRADDRINKVVQQFEITDVRHMRVLQLLLNGNYYLIISCRLPNIIYERNYSISKIDWLPLKKIILVCGRASKRLKMSWMKLQTMWRILYW